MRASTITKRVAEGVGVGLLYYAVYVVALPSAVAHIGQGISLEFGHAPAYSLYLLIALSVASALLKDNILGPVFRALTKVLGIALLFAMLNEGELNGSMTYGGLVISFSINVLVVLYVVAIFSITLSALDIVEGVRTLSRTNANQ